MKYISKFTGKYSFLSNFYLVPLYHDGIWFTSSESAFQASKATNILVKLRFANLSPSDAKNLGRKIELRSDWEKVKINIMKEILYQKFLIPNLFTKLLDTDDAILEEGNTWGDAFWGKVNGSGENNLGKILMEIRDNFNNLFRKT